MFANQFHHAIPARRAVHAVRECRLGLPGLLAIESCRFPLASPGEGGAAVTAETRGRLGSISANQINHAIPDRRAAHVVRECRRGVALLQLRPPRVGSSRGPRFPLSTCVPGRGGASATAETRGRLGSTSTNQINHAIPARRAPHVVRERRRGVGLLAIESCRFPLASPGGAGASATRRPGVAWDRFPQIKLTTRSRLAVLRTSSGNAGGGRSGLRLPDVDTVWLT
jgi:hypothetical protein